METGPVFEGTLQELGDRGPIELLRFLNVDDKITYRFTVEMDDTQEAVDKTARSPRSEFPVAVLPIWIQKGDVQNSRLNRKP